MNPISETIQWFIDGDNWTGASGIPMRIIEHFQYSFLALIVAVLIALPLGMILGHLNRGNIVVISLANTIRALPTLGVLTLLVIISGIGIVPPLVALVILAIPPILVNTFEGIRSVDQTIVSAARGLGLEGPQILLKVETPSALPLIISGVRLAAIQVVSIATVAAYVGLGGLGRFIFDGFGRRDLPQILGGSLLATVVAVITEFAFLLLATLLVSRGITRKSRRIKFSSDRGIHPSIGTKGTV